MQKIRHTTTVPNRPADADSGSFGYAIDENLGTLTPGTNLTAKWVNDVTDEIGNVVTSPAGGNAALSASDQTQLLTAIQTMITNAKQSVLVFEPSSPNNTNTVADAGSFTINAGSSQQIYPTQTIDALTVPTNTVMMQCRVYLNTNSGGNVGIAFDVRKNSSETFAQKVLIDTTGGTGAAWEGEHWASFPVYIDPATGKFDWRVIKGAASSTGGSITVTVYVDGYWVQKLV